MIVLINYMQGPFTWHDSILHSADRLAKAVQTSVPPSTSENTSRKTNCAQGALEPPLLWPGGRKYLIKLAACFL